MIKNRQEWDTNRSMARKPSRKGSWCDICDMAKVFDGQKCPFCGNRIKPSRNKKELDTAGNTL